MPRLLALAVALGLTAAPAFADTAPAQPTVAVVGVTGEGVVADGYDPGKAFATLLTDKLVEIGKLGVVERENVEKVFDEQKLSQSADFSTQDAVKLGHTVGANYLIVGRVIHLDKVAVNRGGAGALLSAVPFNIGGAGVSSEKVHCQVSVRIVDATTGRIVKSAMFEQTQNGTSFVVGDLGAATEIYSSQQFTSSVIGKLLNAAAADLGQKISDAPLTKAASGPSLEATIIALDGANVILNKGTADGLTAGTFLDVFHRISAKDPATGKTLVTDVPDGQIQVTSVSANSSVARKISGNPVVRGIARTQ